MPNEMAAALKERTMRFALRVMRLCRTLPETWEARFVADQLLRAVRGADKGAIADVKLFDVFAGAGVPDGSKSLALEVTLQPSEKSFTEDDLKAISARIVAAAANLGAALRAG